jgi:putative transposase
MKYDPQIHHRRSIRLARYDYAQPGAYFVTICTYNRELSLQADKVKEAVRSVWLGLPPRFPCAVLDEFVIMPNHLHGIIILAPAAASRGAACKGAASGAPTLGQIIRTFKSLAAMEANRILGFSERPFWQRNYYEHVIRDDDELNIIRQYIRDNPRNWPDDPDSSKRGAASGAPTPCMLLTLSAFYTAWGGGSGGLRCRPGSRSLRPRTSGPGTRGPLCPR